jgi:hypothetical protein
MTMSSRTQRGICTSILVATIAASATAQSPTPDGPPVRRIATATAVSKEPIGQIASIRELPDGRVLLNDGSSRRLLLLDTMLVLQRVVLDSVSETENTYGTEQGADSSRIAAIRRSSSTPARWRSS